MRNTARRLYFLMALIYHARRDMRLAILGGTSKLAQSFMNQVLRHGYDVSSLIPHNSTPQIKHDKLATAHGSWENESDLRLMMNGCHVAVCMPEVQQNAAAMAVFVAAAYQSGVRRVIVVTDVLGHLAHEAHLPLAHLLQHTDLDWTIVHAERALQNDFIAPLHEIAIFVLNQISDATHLSKTVLVRAA
jgi:hypothetical protein